MARPFRSQNLGVCRLAVVISIAAFAYGVRAQKEPFRALQQKGWDHAHYQEEIAKHPELSLTQNEAGWYLQDEQIEKRSKENCERVKENFAKRWAATRHAPGQTPEMFAPYCGWNWQDSVVERFPRTADRSPELSDYLPLTLPPLGAVFLAWILVHTVAWVITGFRVSAATE